MVSEEQIQRFFAKQCTDEEAEQVAAWLQTHPGVAAQYLDEKEWYQLSSGEPMPEETSSQVWYKIHKKIRKQKTYRLLKRSAVAALLTGCFATGFLYVGRKKPLAAAVVSHTVQQINTVATADTEYNYTHATRRILLSDHSTISLSPGSVVWFDTPFAAKNIRNIYLRGEARFEVAKNKQKPFTVFAGNFSTTALGTEFIVKQFNSNINVQLIHGKVVIKATDNTVKNWKNIYLLPGQQMLYNANEGLAKVSTAGESKTGSTKSVAKISAQRETESSLIFNGSPMSTVLQKLHSYYNVDIQFDKADIKNISFTGVIVKKDSVQTILKVITEMNGLSVENNDGSFIITKEKN